MYRRFIVFYLHFVKLVGGFRLTFVAYYFFPFKIMRNGVSVSVFCSNVWFSGMVYWH